MNKRIFVNALTVSRIPLAVLFCCAVLSAASPFFPCIFLFAGIAASDYFDGKLARKYGIQSAAGAVLDVAADFFFILSACLSLHSRGLFPGWMLAVILLKFLEFWGTSAVLKRGGGNASAFLFDPLGRIAAVLFYLLPVLILALSHFLPAGIRQAATAVLCAGMAACAILSSVWRISLLVKSRRPDP